MFIFGQLRMTFFHKIMVAEKSNSNYFFNFSDSPRPREIIKKGGSKLCECTRYHLTNSLSPTEIMKNQGGKNKQMQIQKRESRELIPYIANLTGLFIFSRFNNKRKSRHHWREICLN